MTPFLKRSIDIEIQSQVSIMQICYIYITMHAQKAPIDMLCAKHSKRSIVNIRKTSEFIQFLPAGMLRQHQRKHCLFRFLRRSFYSCIPSIPFIYILENQSCLLSEIQQCYKRTQLQRSMHFTFCEITIANKSTMSYIQQSCYSKYF